MDETKQKTYTLDELVGKGPRWVHWYRPSLGRALCGYVWPAGSIPRPETPNDRMCPDCDRIKKNERP